MPVTQPMPPSQAGIRPRPPALRLPCPPPSPEALSDFALLLRRLLLLRGCDNVMALESETALSLLELCASAERDRQALRAFTPLVASGLLQLLDPSGANHDDLCSSIAQRVTIRPALVAEIAAALRSSLLPAARSAPTGSMEQLALAGAARFEPQRTHHPYNTNLWIALLAFGGLALAGVSLLAFGMGNRLAERRGGRSPAPSPTAVPAAVAQPAAQKTAPIDPPAPAAAVDSEPASAPGRWRACAGLPSPSASPGRWGVLAPIAVLQDMQLRCSPDARPYGPWVLLARFDQRSAAEQLASELSGESGQTLQISSLDAP